MYFSNFAEKLLVWNCSKFFGTPLIFPNYFNTERRFTLLASCEPWQHDWLFVIFWTKGIEILALLIAKLSNSKMYKVGTLFPFNGL